MTRRAFGPLLLLMAVIAGCAETTVDPTRTTPASSVATTPPFTVAATTAGLLDQLAAETAGLSALIIEGDGQRESLARIEAVWAALRPEIEETHPDLVAEYESVVDMTRRAVERRRPADADKAHNNLRTLLAATSG